MLLILQQYLEHKKQYIKTCGEENKQGPRGEDRE